MGRIHARGERVGLSGTCHPEGAPRFDIQRGVKDSEARISANTCIVQFRHSSLLLACSLTRLLDTPNSCLLSSHIFQNLVSTFHHSQFKLVTMAPTKSFPAGIHVPSLTWFGDDASQEIDWDVQTKHIEFLVNSGLHGGRSPS